MLLRMTTDSKNESTHWYMIIYFYDYSVIYQSKNFKNKASWSLFMEIKHILSIAPTG